jgi:hypothetical protein
MLFVFCSDPFDSRKPDEAYAKEAAAITGLGSNYILFSYEALVDDSDPQKATRRVLEANEKETAIYRGWMLTPESYAELYQALLAKSIVLINSPEQYRHCYYLPESYSIIKEYTPRSVWLPEAAGLTMDNITNALRPFGDSPVILNDFVKSQKHAWNEACFIPSASDTDTVERVVNRFLDLQGDDLQGGLVFRKFVELEPLATHSKSGMPLTKEYRIFFLDKKTIYWTQYWEEGDYGDTAPPILPFSDVGDKVQSRFFTMDIARRKNGGWIVIELGDAQVAGLPENASADSFYKAILDQEL